MNRGKTFSLFLFPLAFVFSVMFFSFAYAATAPGAPTGVAATPGDGQATVYFTAPASDGGSAITGYTVTSIPAGGTDTNAGSTSLSHVITGLTDNTAYTFTVTATNAIGTSTASSASTAVTPAVTLLSDNFSGTTINTTKWTVTDTAGTNVSQNNGLLVKNSYSGGWGAVNVKSKTTFASSGLNIAVAVTRGQNSGAPIDTLFGYGDPNFNAAGTSAFVVYASASSLAAITYNNGASNTVGCGGSITDGTIYKLAVTGTGYAIYKNAGSGDVLLCNVPTAVTITNKPVFFQSGATGTPAQFNSLTVQGLGPTYTITGPARGLINTASSSFTVSPSAAYTGTITITPSGGGLSTPIVLNFNNSSTPQTFTITPTTGGLMTLALSNNGGLINPSTMSYAAITIGSSNSGLAYSPFNWYQGSGYAISQTPGAYIKTNFTGTSAIITLSEDPMVLNNGLAAYYPRLRYQVDGGATTEVLLTPTTTSIVAATGLSPGTHSLFILFSGDGGGTVSNPDRWITPAQAIEFTGLVLDNGATVSAPTLFPKRMLVYGDSISEGVYVNGITGSFPNTDEDITKAVPWLLAKDLNLELGSRALGGGGWSGTGSGGVPAIYTPGNDTSSSWNKYSYGKSLLTGGLFTPAPDYIYMNHGTNDNGSTDANLIAIIDGWLPAVRTAAPNAVIFIIVPFGQYKASAITSAYNAYIAANPSDKKVFLIDLGPAAATLISSGGAPDSLHPYAATDATFESEMLPMIKADLFPGAPTAVTATGGVTSATVSFTAPASAGTSAITGYTVTSIPAGGTDTNAGSTSLSHVITGLTPGTPYTFTVTATNGDGTGSASTASNSVTPTVSTAPVLSTPVVTPSTTSAVITWTSDLPSSSQVNHGPSTGYGHSTALTDTSPRVTNHTVTISGLLACTTYHYTASGATATSATVTSADAVFTTTGCTGNAPVSAAASTAIPTSGGTVSTASSAGDSATLTVPNAYNGSSLTFQVKSLDQQSFFAAASSPSGITAPSTPIVYNMKALDSSGAAVTTFSTPLSVTLHYTDAQIANLSESSLVIYRYDSGAWTALSNCSVDIGANTVTCTTSHFSDFAIFGTPAPAASSGTTSYVSGGGGPVHTTTSDCQTGERFSASSGLPCAVTPAVTTPNPVSTATFTMNLSLGSHNAQVQLLQQYLNTHGYVIAKTGPGSPGHETTTFGPATKTAVMKFQKAKHISPANGSFGPLTRKAVNLSL